MKNVSLLNVIVFSSERKCPHHPVFKYFKLIAWQKYGVWHIGGESIICWWYLTIRYSQEKRYFLLEKRRDMLQNRDALVLTSKNNLH